MGIFEAFAKITKSEPAGKVEYIVAGLGNIGIQYENTRHNAGFMALDKIAVKYNVKIDRMKFKSNCAEAIISGKKCLLLKPSTYMNNSGEAVVQAMNFYKIPIENVIVIYDDISLPPSKLRIRRKGTHGGHNGIKSIIELTGEETFPRIKIGVGQKPHKDYNLADWVLSKFTEEDMKQLDTALNKAVEAVEYIVGGETEKAMNKLNS